MGLLNWLSSRSDQKGFHAPHQDPILLLNALLSATPTQQHYINEMLTRAIGELVIKAGDTVLDVGANQGFHLFAFADLVGQQGLVHAFEPNPCHWPLLVGRDNVRLWPFAAGDKCSVECFFFPKNHDGAASLHDPRDFLGNETEVQLLNVVQVPIDTLDEVLRRQIKFIKLDVERHELQALTGMRILIARDRPIVVLENATPDIKAFFETLQFRSVPMTYSGWGSKDTLLPNMLFVPNERSESECAPDKGKLFGIIEASREFR
ncbi:hypothetical protein CU048_01050 [Beijerinckiaceae bacterium]|nr:hypothetical protein CU048_01050 [Beijerinckiaceae bacterium]